MRQKWMTVTRMKLIGITAIAVATFVATSVTRAVAPQPPAPAPAPAPAPPASTTAGSGGRSTSLPPDANGNTMRVASAHGARSRITTGRICWSKRRPISLTLANGRKVTSADVWTRERRPEIVKLYDVANLRRRAGERAKVTWNVTETDPAARNGAALMKKIVGTAGTGPNAPTIRVTQYTPANATGRVPMTRVGVRRRSGDRAGASAVADPPNAAEILARGWGSRPWAIRTFSPIARTPSTKA